MNVDPILSSALGFAAGWAVRAVTARRATPEPTPAAEAPEPPTEAPPPDPYGSLFALRDRFRGDYDAAARPEDLLRLHGFVEMVRLLGDAPFGERDLIEYYDGACPILAAAAIVALAHREPSEAALDDVLREIHDVDFFSRSFALRLLRERGAQRALGPLLRAINPSWLTPWGRRVLRDHLAALFGSEPPPDVADLADAARSNDEVAEEWFASLVDDLQPVGAAFAALLRTEVENDGASAAAPASPAADGAPPSGLALLRSFGRLVGGDGTDPAPIVDERVRRQADAIRGALRPPRRRSVVLVGEPGAGKSAAARAALADLEHVIVFEAGASDLLAGQRDIGMLEERIRGLLDAFRGSDQRLVWICPAIHELAWAGRHDNSPISILDQVLPFVEDGTVTMVGEASPAEWDRVVRAVPAVRTAFELVDIGAPTDAEAAALARRWLERAAGTAVDDAVLGETLRLAQQHLDDVALPGSVLRLLEHALRQRATPDAALTRDDLFRSVGALTGLPRDVLDDKASLDVGELRAFFEARVMGQPEAIDCLVERVAMIKAGLTDPTRPQGVFLFTGPTGTGKTEIAKALAQWLFGSPERMVRLDMSELQDGGAMSRVLGEGSAFDDSQALVHRVRQQPFTIVLLDEFEKAHPAIWDLFLQIFDDGRLTDRRGRRADFRHTIVIATSNVGGAQAQGANLGFGGERDQAVLLQLQRTFRPEFLNRIDRIVTFRPLSEATMRRVLEKELRLALERRGLRTRQWAVEWDDTALDFLLRAGFSAELGARPLRRAIERHFLAPLAKTIVGQRAPAGDQFPFVRSGGQRIDVQFVDPDAPDHGGATSGTGGELDLAAVVLDGAGSPDEIAFLEARLNVLDQHVRQPDWLARKTRALDATSAPDFWTSDDRFAVLGVAESVERIGVGLETATRLFRRLRGRTDAPRSGYDPELTRRVAQQLYLLEQAVQDVEGGTPREAFLQVEALPDARGDAGANAFAARLWDMYGRWARRRGMTFEELVAPRGADAGPFVAVLAVSGYGAYSLLAPEHGLHVFEAAGEHPNTTERCRVRVSVTAQPDAPANPDTPAGRRTQARTALDACWHGPDIVRRYREEPSPLVRDAARGWRTGRVDRVFDGDFDLVR